MTENSAAETISLVIARPRGLEMKCRWLTVASTMAAALTMSLLTSDALARRFELSEQKFLASWSSASPFFFAVAGFAARCPVTLDGSFHSKTLSKTCGQLIGYLNQAIVANSNCTGGHMTALTETLPWHIRYFRFSGTLPNITSIWGMMVGVRLQIEQGEGLICLVATSSEHPMVFNIEREAGGKATGLAVLPEFTIPLRGEFFCEIIGEGSLAEGTAAVSSSSSGRPPITVRLVA